MNSLIGAPKHEASAQPDPLVSIIIPCYNGEAFLREAIESAVAQTYGGVEVIVVDDGSTDRSAEIAQTFPIRYVRQPNRGLTASRNLGISQSRGSYIMFLDADDRLLPEAVQAGLSVLAERPDCAMTVGDHVFIAEDGSYLSHSRKDCLQSSHYEALLKSNFIEMISSVLLRRSIFDEVGGFDPELRVAEDYELYLRIARNAGICCHQAVVAEYRMHKTNASHNSELMLTMTLAVLRGQTPYVRSHPRRLFAFIEGSRSWRKQYGRQLASELARCWATLGTDQLQRKLRVLANCYPQGLAVLLLLRIMPKLDHRHPVSAGRNRMHERSVMAKLHAWLNASKPLSTAQTG